MTADDMRDVRRQGSRNDQVLRGLPRVPARAVALAAGGDARRDHGAVARDARGAAAVRRDGGQAPRVSRNGTRRQNAKTSETIQFSGDAQVRWIIANGGNGSNGYEAGKRAYVRIKPVHTPSEYEEFCRALARACGL
jgi:hypothetical protein